MSLRDRRGPCAIATITLARPDAANAQSSQLIDELDAAFDRAEADDDVHVIVLAADGKHFSAGHDLKEILAGEEHWAAIRATPEGKLEHEQVMYWDKLVRIRDCPKITIAAVQGVCSAAGLMLAATATALWQVYVGFGLGLGLGIGFAFVPSIAAVQRIADRP